MEIDGIIAGPLDLGDTENWPEIILGEFLDVPKKYIEPMLEARIYDLDELKLRIKGGFKDGEDIKFAQEGNFSTIKEVRSARKLECTTLIELTAVKNGNWPSGEIYRYAISQGFESFEYNLFQETKDDNGHIRWDKSEIAWARSASSNELQRLKKFSSIRAMEFYDYLFTLEEEIFRTDRLMAQYKELNTPGPKIATEGKFEDFLSEPAFSGVVDVTEGGLTKILLNSGAVNNIHPRADPASYPLIKKSRTELAKSLRAALNANNLGDSTVDSWSWLCTTLRAHLGLSAKDDLESVVEKLNELLGLTKTQRDLLHTARMARNWISHKDGEFVEPSWDSVEYVLDTAEKLSAL